MKERLQKLISAAGLTSRRKAEEWLLAGRVTVNGQVASLATRPIPMWTGWRWTAVPSPGEISVHM